MAKHFMKFAAENIRVHSRRFDAVILIVLILVSFLPRLTDLGNFLTADEKTWIVRSYEFIRAVKDVRLNDTLQTTHPGVTALWVSGLTITAKMFLSHIPFTTSNLFYFVKSAQFPIAFLNALAIPLMYLLLQRMSGRLIAFSAAALIALDPFIIGYSRVIHVDALLASLLTLAVISTILYARTLKRTWLVISAVCSAFALLTKIPAVFIIPFFPLAIAVLYPEQLFTREFFTVRARDVLLWILGIVLIILVVWPALLWVPNPVGNALTIRRDVTIAATVPHNTLEEYSLQPLHYPATLLTRSNPVTLVGAVAGIMSIIFLACKKQFPRELGLILLYLVGFIVMMTLGAKKGDRYIMPAFFALDIVAAFGIVWVCTLIHNTRKRRIALAATGLLSTIYLLYTTISYHPYEIAYSNPLFPDNISQELGWGEGLEQVGAWLNKNYPNETVASWYPEELDVYTEARVAHINAHVQNHVRFVVLYRNMFGRDPSHYANDFIDEYYKKQEPVFVVSIRGKEFAWVYEKPSYSNNIGALTPNVVVAQEIIAFYQGLAGLELLPATKSGRATTGSYIVELSRTLNGPSILSRSIVVQDVQDSTWHVVADISGLGISQGEHVFIRVRAVNASAPYPSLRFSRNRSRTTPVYISRTGNIQDAQPKPGSLAVRLTYRAIDGTIATETQTKLLLK